MTGDPSPEGNGTTGYGSVSYSYVISKNEVTNAQYAEFLNAVAATDPNGLYGGGAIVQSGTNGGYTYAVIPGLEDRPVEPVSFWDAARFANWMHNGQPTGLQGLTTTEDGAYTLTPEGIASNSVLRNPTAAIFIPSENEWYKAAYYHSSLGVYYDYPTGTDVQTTCAIPLGDTGNSANCNGAVGSATIVGAYGLSESPYGTLDQGGNAFEWTETIHQDSTGAYRVKRGGGWDGSVFGTPENLSASVRYGVLADFQGPTGTGFRLAGIPEPSSALLLAAGLVGLAARSRLKEARSRRVDWARSPRA